MGANSQIGASVPDVVSFAEPHKPGNFVGDFQSQHVTIERDEVVEIRAPNAGTADTFQHLGVLTYLGPGGPLITPSWRIIPAISSACQSSAILPFLILRIPMPVTS